MLALLHHLSLPCPLASPNLSTTAHAYMGSESTCAMRVLPPQQRCLVLYYPLAKRYSMPGVLPLQGMPCHGMLSLKDPLWNNVFHSGLEASYVDIS